MSKLGKKDVSNEKAKDSKLTILRLIQYLNKFKISLIIAFACLLIAVVTDLISVYVMAPIIDDYIKPMMTATDSAVYMIGLAKMVGLYVALALVSTITTYFASRVMIRVSQDVVKVLRDELMEKIETLPIKYFDEHPYGELMSRITNDMDNIGTTLNTSIGQIISGILTVVGCLVSMLCINVWLSIISIITIPVISLTVGKIIGITRRQFVKQQECLADLNSYVEEYVSGQKVVKAFNKEEEVLSNFDVKNTTLKMEGFKAQFTSGAVYPISGAINMISTAITMLFAGISAINGKITVGNIISFNKFANNFGRPINETASQFATVQAGIAGAERIFNILDETSEYENETGDVVVSTRGHVEFKNVNFGYEDTPVIKKFSLEVTPGQTIALVGPTGAGKTTIINLLTRYYDVNSGEILLDGKNINTIDKKSLRNMLGIVLQDSVMFSETVKDNIRFGKLEATQDEIFEAAKVANAHEYISKLPNEYDTLLAEDATNISVGQKQLLNIARVALNDPQILILDEATSNVDTRTEVHVQQAMERLINGRTSFVIAHRLSTIRNADIIVVINDGQIVEMGNHTTLIDKKGIYYKMYSGMFQQEKA